MRLDRKLKEWVIVIAGGGVSPLFLERSWEDFCKKSGGKERVSVVAVDRGADSWFSLFKSGKVLLPDWVVGDFDSFKKEGIPTGVGVLEFSKEKDFSDLEGALREISKSPMVKRVCIVGIVTSLEKRFDHALGVFLAALKFCPQFESIEFLNPEGLFICLSQGNSYQCALKKGVPFSVFSFFESRVTLKGARYELLDAVLSPGTQGLSNESLGEEISFQVHSGAGIFAIPGYF